MAWGDGKPEGNEGSSCLQASPPPRPLALGRSTSLCGVHTRYTAGANTRRTVGTVMLVG